MVTSTSESLNKTNHAALKRAIKAFADDTDTGASVGEAFRQIAPEELPGPIYVAKLTSGGVLNQVWQGKSVSTQPEAMVFVASVLDPVFLDRAEGAVRGRLHPERTDGGLEAAILGTKSGNSYSVSAVVEYDHMSVGEHLKTTPGLENITILKVPFVGNSKTYDAPSFAAEEGALTVDELKVHLSEAYNVVLQGPPGTGKTFLAEQLISTFPGARRASEIMEGKAFGSLGAAEWSAPELVWEIVQLHSGYSYEDFVRGLRTDANGSYDLLPVDGLLPTMCRIAEARAEKPTILIIDEINRGDLASIMGETIFALDPAHRGEEVKLLYPGKGDVADGLRVPFNLFVLATMNTADRSISSIDVAIRRRFRFLTLRPSPEAFVSYYSDEHRQLKCKELLALLMAAVPDQDLQPGHSYLLVKGPAPLDMEAWARALSDKILYEIRPLLEEYRNEGRTVKAVPLPGMPGLDLVLSDPVAVQSRLITWLQATDL